MSGTHYSGRRAHSSACKTSAQAGSTEHPRRVPPAISVISARPSPPAQPGFLEIPAAGTARIAVGPIGRGNRPSLHRRMQPDTRYAEAARGPDGVPRRRLGPQQRRAPIGNLAPGRSREPPRVRYGPAPRQAGRATPPRLCSAPRRPFPRAGVPPEDRLAARRSFASRVFAATQPGDLRSRRFWTPGIHDEQEVDDMDDSINLAEKFALLGRPYEPGIIGYPASLRRSRRRSPAPSLLW